MADVIKTATRDAYGKALVELGQKNDKVVVLDADLAKATKTIAFKKEFPDRFFDTGIAECNMMGVAAGLATTGYTVFASSFAMFAAGRAFEQIRNSIGYTHLNVKIGATHAGISVGEDGASHQCCEDIALMRTIPGMVVINPADDVEARLAVLAAAEIDGPVYLRFGRLATPRLFGDDYKFEIGKGVELKAGTDVTIIATGLMVNEALIAAEHLELVTKDAFTVMTKIKNAGAIFIGEYSSEPLGDYFAGPNHVLPTNGTAKFFSPLEVDDFIKKSSIISYSKEALAPIHEDIIDFAKAEGLTAHANSIAVRFGKEVK